MRLFYLLICFLFVQINTEAQRFDGQWRGGFTDNSSGFVGFGGDKIDYVLELQCDGSAVTGYSYTYFSERGKRYFTICKLRGTLNKESKEVIVTEFERSKYNTPPDFRNCFQTHKLRYIKDTGNVETLEGSWIPAPNQQGDCGFGKTSLTRRLLKTIPAIQNSKAAVASNKKNLPFRDMNKARKLSPVLKPKITAQDKTAKPAPLTLATKKNIIAKTDKEIKNVIPIITPGLKNESIITNSKISFEKRSKSLLKTIEILRDTFTVQLYDNGEIDGDSVSLFYNGALLISHERLTDKPITLTLHLDKSADINELTMYADNLGTIPPNTALMIVNDGDKRYEVRITSDTEKNGTIAFTHKNN